MNLDEKILEEKQLEKKIKAELKWLITAVGLGASLVVYGHTTFATKSEVKTNSDTLKVIDERVYDLHLRSFPEKHEDE